jgi:hypothetical protein
MSKVCKNSTFKIVMIKKIGNTLNEEYQSEWIICGSDYITQALPCFRIEGKNTLFSG